MLVTKVTQIEKKELSFINAIQSKYDDNPIEGITSTLLKMKKKKFLLLIPFD